MRVARLALLVLLLALPLVLTPGAGALDLEVDVQPPPGEVGTPYEFAFLAEEGCVPYFFSYLNGTVPPGLVITENGLLKGTPTEAGTFTFWVELTDNSKPDNPFCFIPSTPSQAPFTMIALPDLAVSTTALPNGIPGRQYSTQLEFTNPEAGWPVVWDITAGSLPGGLTLSESGLISGTAAGADRTTFTVRAREPFRRFGERELTLTVAAQLAADSQLGAGEVGLRYAGAVRASGGVAPLSWSVANGTLPAGLVLDASSGAVRGVPRAAGLYDLTFAVTDSAGQRATVPAIVRIASKLTVVTKGLPAASVGQGYTARLRTTGGIAPKRWRLVRGSLPPGLRLDPATGTLAGEARAAGVYRLIVEARDRLGARSLKPFRLTVTS